MKLFKSKKGLVQDVFFIMVVIFTFAVTTMLSVAVWLKFVDIFNAMPSSVADASTKAQISGMTKYMYLLDHVFIYMIIALWILLIISSVTVGVEHPIFFFGFLIFSLLFAFVAMVLTNVYQKFTTITDLQVAISSLPIINSFMQEYHIITFVVTIIAGVIFYSRQRTDSYGNAP